MRVVFGNPNVAAWVAARVVQMGPRMEFGPHQAIGVIDHDGAPMGGVVFHDYRPHLKTIEMTGAADSKRWLSRPIVNFILGYAFYQLGCVRITAITPKKNRAARAVLEKLGFMREGCARKGFGPYGDAMIYGLLQDDFRNGPFASARRVKRPLTPVEAAVS